MRNRPKVVKEDGSSAQVFPDDLVHEIVARCPTVDDVIRCAATSRPIRRGILNERFLRRLVRDEGRGPFVPSVLLGVYRKTDHPHRPLAFVPAVDVAEKCPASVATLPPAPQNRNTACRYGAYLPVASRRSLLVLRRRCGVREQEHLQESHGLHAVEISVCNPTTGERRVLPPHDVADTSYAALDVRPLARPAAFKLLVAELTDQDPKTVSAQIFSSEDGDWGPVVYCHIARCCEFAPGPGGRPSSVVLGDTVNWLCSTGAGHRILLWRWRDNDTLQKTSLIKLPSPVPGWFQEICLATLPSAQDAAGAPELLGLIVLEPGEVEVWVRKKKIGAGSPGSCGIVSWGRTLRGRWVPATTDAFTGERHALLAGNRNGSFGPSVARSGLQEWSEQAQGHDLGPSSGGRVLPVRD
jgi:hypothetical protein